MSDGLTIPFAISCRFKRAAVSNSSIIVMLVLQKLQQVVIALGLVVILPGNRTGSLIKVNKEGI